MRERIRLQGRSVASGPFRRDVARLAAAGLAGPREGFRTTFEHLTALAFLAFQEAAVDVAIVEVGLGGRLDATKSSHPAAILCSDLLDHRQILGNTVARIAADKAHILKRGGRGFVMPQSPSAWRAVLGRCRREGIRPVRTAEAVPVRAEAWDMQGTRFRIQGREDYGIVATGLLGAHQEANVGAAVAVAETLLPEGRIRGAVRRGLSGARIPGRLDHERWGGSISSTGAGRRRPEPCPGLDGIFGPGVAAVVGMARDRIVGAF
jgi:dihydrofolate synthase/folylpolyglutamate synthase